MARKRTHHRRGSRRRHMAPSVSMVTYTRIVDLSVNGPSNDATAVATADITDVTNTSGETVNRKIVGIHGSAVLHCGLAANQHVAAMICFRAAPTLSDFPSIVEWDPFNDGPREGTDPTGYEGRPSPRPFARRNFVLATSSHTASTTELVTEQHAFRSRAERLLRPGWKLQAGLYVRASQSVNVRWYGLLRFSVAG